MLYLSAEGQVYGGDRQRRADGTLDPIAPDRPGSAYKWTGTTWAIPTPALDWAGLCAEFRTPGNALYLSVYARVDDADRWRNGQLLTLTVLLGLGALTNLQTRVVAASLVKDHFANFKNFALSGEVRSTDHLRLAILKLSALLMDAGYGLSASDISGWNALIDKYGFPSSCKL